MSTNLNDKRDNAIIKQVDNSRSEIDYITRDYAIDFLVNQFKEGDFFIPSEYQRQFIWKDSDKCRFIESILLGYPIPFMFFSDNDDGRTEIIDGAQRTSTLDEFLDDELKLSGLEYLTELNNSTFKQMPPSIQRKFSKTTLRVVALSEGTTIKVRQEIFNRINTSGMHAKPIETRRGTYPGKFMDFLTDCANKSLFKKLCPVSKNSEQRYESIELVLRFFAFLNNYINFEHRVDEFLDMFIKEHQNKFEKKNFTKEFERMLEFVNKNFEYGFRKSKAANSVPRTRFEAIAVGVALALRTDEQLNPKISPTHWTNIDSEEGKDFKYHTTTHSSNTKKRVTGRIEYVRDMLLTGKGRGKE
ncbi:MAG: DUF262 domain-containing protein [Fibromonadaceae bacterium]|jgi:hypothetical protein|nr:DUF262 domain-containing protein [Fibromonadaceae bacterium]